MEQIAEQMMRARNEEPVSLVLVATKSDLEEERGVTVSEMLESGRENAMSMH